MGRARHCPPGAPRHRPSLPLQKNTRTPLLHSNEDALRPLDRAHAVHPERETQPEAHRYLSNPGACTTLGSRAPAMPAASSSAAAASAFAPSTTPAYTSDRDLWGGAGGLFWGAGVLLGWGAMGVLWAGAGGSAVEWVGVGMGVEG